MTQIIITADETPITLFAVLSDPVGEIENSGTLSFSLLLEERDGSRNTSLSAGEVLDATILPDIPGESAQYLGFLTLGGVDYPVFRQTESGWLVAGIALDPVEYPNINTILPLLNTTDSFTDFDSICFAARTMIATPDGSRAVESLRIGDTVLRAEGGTAQVRWIGRQTLRPWLGGADKARLVRIAAGALGDGLPQGDLCVTADHALVIDGLLINAGALVNGTSITQERVTRDCTVYHIETEDHDVILAQGVPAETFIDYVGRQAFDNHAEYVALYGEGRALAEMAIPRVSSARMLPRALRARLGIDRVA